MRRSTASPPPPPLDAQIHSVTTTTGSLQIHRDAARRRSRCFRFPHRRRPPRHWLQRTRHRRRQRPALPTYAAGAPTDTHLGAPKYLRLLDGATSTPLAALESASAACDDSHLTTHFDSVSDASTHFLSSSSSTTCSMKSPVVVSSFTAPMPVYSISNELFLDPILAATSSSGIDVVPSSVNNMAPINCSAKCPSCIVGAMGSAVVYATIDMNLGGFTLQQVLDGKVQQVLDGKVHNMFNIVLQSSRSALGTAPNISNIECSEHPLIHDALVLCELPIRCVDPQPWPPPFLLELLLESAMIRPMPWPNFTMNGMCSAHGCSSWLLTPPWPPPAPKTFRYKVDIIFGLELLNSLSFGQMMFSVYLLNFRLGTERNIYQLHRSEVEFKQKQIAVSSRLGVPMMLDIWHACSVAQLAPSMSFCCYKADMKSNLLLLLLLVRLLCTNTVGRNSKIVVLRTQGSSLVKDNIITVIGLPTFKCLEPFSVTISDGCRIEGFLSKSGPGTGRSLGDRQFFYVNGRPVDIPTVTKLVNELYRSSNAKQFPVVILDFCIPTTSYDVNVAPDKRKFSSHLRVCFCIWNTEDQISPENEKVSSPGTRVAIATSGIPYPWPYFNCNQIGAYQDCMMVISCLFSLWYIAADVGAAPVGRVEKSC